MTLWNSFQLGGIPTGNEELLAASSSAPGAQLYRFPINGLPYAPIDSPHFTGAPTAPTGTLGDRSNQIATDAFVAASIANAPQFAVGLFNGIINVKDAVYGAKGDGVTDDTAAIAAAAAAIPARGSMLYLPPGTYLVHATTFLPSNTYVLGVAGATTMLAAPVAAWGLNPNLPFFQNVNSTGVPNSPPTPLSYTDHDITIEGIAFDYGIAFGAFPNASSKQLYFQSARHVYVRNCVFQLRGGEDAIAFVACYDTQAENCRSYGAVNASYDAWWGPQKLKLINCYAETPAATQMVSFNPDSTNVNVAGLVMDGVTISGCEFVCTGGTRAPLQIEPLAGNTSMQNVEITNNIFRNATVVIRGLSTNVAVTDNIFLSPLGGDSVITSYSLGGGAGSAISVIDNIIVNPDTVGGAQGVIRLETSNSDIHGNIITGTAYGATAGIRATDLTTIAYGNSVSNGTVTAAGPSDSQSIVSAINKGFAWTDASGSRPVIVQQGDNNWIFYGTAASGGLRVIFNCIMRSDVSTFNVGPNLNLGNLMANFVAVQGAATGVAPLIAAFGSDTNIPLQLVGRGADGALLGAYKSAGAPTGAVSADQQFFLWKNTTDGTAALFYNDAGTLRTTWLSPGLSFGGALNGTAYTVTNDSSIIINPSGPFTLTLPSATGAAFGRMITVKLIANQAVVSASANVVPLAGGSASTAILSGTAGKWCTLESDGTNWQIMAAN